MWYDNVKRIPFSFNIEAFELVVDFIKNWKLPKYKEIRRGHFSPQYSSDYQVIITAIELNMQALGYASDEIYGQACAFWENIVLKSACSILNFLDLRHLFELTDQNKNEMEPKSIFEQEDYIYLNQTFIRDWNKFYDKWIRRIN